MDGISINIPQNKERKRETQAQDIQPQEVQVSIQDDTMLERYRRQESIEQQHRQQENEIEQRRQYALQREQKDENQFFVEISMPLGETDTIPNGPGREERQTYTNLRMLYADTIEVKMSDVELTATQFILPFLEQVKKIR